VEKGRIFEVPIMCGAEVGYEVGEGGMIVAGVGFPQGYGGQRSCHLKEDKGRMCVNVQGTVNKMVNNVAGTVAKKRRPKRLTVTQLLFFPYQGRASIARWRIVPRPLDLPRYCLNRGLALLAFESHSYLLSLHFFMACHSRIFHSMLLLVESVHV